MQLEAIASRPVTGYLGEETREAAGPARLWSSKGVPPSHGSPQDCRAPGDQRWRAQPCLQAGAVMELQFALPGTGSTCQAPPRAQPCVRAGSASSWPPNGPGRAKINTPLAGIAALRSLLGEEAVLASAGSSLPRAGSRGRPRRSPCVADGRGTAPAPAMERASPPQPAAGLCTAGSEGWSAAPSLGSGAWHSGERARGGMQGTCLHPASRGRAWGHREGSQLLPGPGHVGGRWVPG